MTADPGPGPNVYLFRHGATEWSESGQHTSRTDLPLTDAGRLQATQLALSVSALDFTEVLVSPLRRARETCELAGLGDRAEECDDLREWDYGELEGMTTSEIRSEYPAWTIWSGPVPRGETLDEVSDRADRVIARVRTARGNVALFAHGHILRVLAARWCELPPVEGRRFPLETGTLSQLGWEHEYPTLRVLNHRG
jgi:probable phosphoglycerate mutase